MNLGTIRTLVSNFVTDQNLTRFTQAQYDNAINLGAQQFCYDSKALYKDASTITIVSGTAGYSLPSDFWLEKQITHKGLALIPVSRATLLRDNGDDWSDDTGTPTHYIIDPEEARMKVTLYPIPQGGDTGANLILTYFPIPATMVGDTDSPFNSSTLMSQFHQGVAAYGAWLLLLYEIQSPEIVVKRNELMKMYLEHKDMAIDKFGNTPQETMRLRPNRRYRSRP